MTDTRRPHWKVGITIDGVEHRTLILANSETGAILKARQALGVHLGAGMARAKRFTNEEHGAIHTVIIDWITAGIF